MKILQLSDLLIGARSETDELNFPKEILAEIGGKVDYLIVCGNITVDGSDVYLQRAAAVFSQLIEILLVDDHTKQNRLIAVPGRSDLQSGAENPANFGRLSLYFKMGLPNGSYIVDDLLVRELKDLTIIALPYVNWKDVGDITSCLHKLEKAKNQVLSEMEYCKLTPTVLITNESPAQDARSRKLIDEGSLLSNTLGDRLRVRLHLFGTSPVLFSIDPELFFHAGVSTGPRETSNPYPLRFNLIEIQATSTWQLNSKSIKWFQKKEKGVRWTSRESREPFFEAALADDVPSKATPLAEGAPAQTDAFNTLRSAFYRSYIASFLEKLGHTAHSRQRAEFLPGQPIDCLDRLDLLPHKITVCDLYYLDLTFDTGKQDQADPAAATLSRLNREVERALKDAKTIEEHDPEADIFVIIRDRAFHKLGEHVRRTWMNEHIRGKVLELENKRLRVVYAHFPSDSEPVIEEVFPEKLDFPPPNEALFQEYIDFGCRDFPVCSRLAQSLASSRFAKFSDLMIEEVRQLFDEWPGATEITATLTHGLFVEGLKGDGLAQLKKDFDEALERFPGWQAVYEALCDICRESVVNTQAKTNIVVSTSEIKKRVDIPENDINRILKILRRHGAFLGQIWTRNSSVSVTTPSLTTSNAPDPDPKKSAKVFVGYARLDREWRDQLAKYLEPYRKDGLSVWWDEHISPGKDWDPEIMKAISDSDMIVFLLSTNLLNSAYVMEHELPFCLGLRDTKKLIVTFIPIAESAYKRTPFAQIQALLTDLKRPLNKMSEVEKIDAYLEICEKIWSLLMKDQGGTKSIAHAPEMLGQVCSLLPFSVNNVE